MGKREDYFNARYREDPETGCWLWTGSRVNDNYGCANIDYKQLLAHRLAFELFVGPIPPGKYVCHICDVPLCVNPAHLFLGDQKDNLEDMTAKGRRATGEAVASWKGRRHTPETIRKMSEARRDWWVRKKG